MTIEEYEVLYDKILAMAQDLEEDPDADKLEVVWDIIECINDVPARQVERYKTKKDRD